MKYFRTRIALLLIVLSSLVAVASIKAGIGRGQSQGSSKADSQGAAKSTSQPEAKRETESLVKPTSLTTTRGADSASAAATVSSFTGAAAQNALLRNDLIWMFAGKQQRGWYLYTSLIDRLLNTEADSASNEFAAALARWQEKTGLKPVGILDEESLKAMVSEWQGARLKNRAYAQPDQLFTAPVSDFYDPERREDLRQVERETYAAYKQMVTVAVTDRSLGLARAADGGLAATEKYLKIVSAFRPREYQDQLRRQSPNAGSAGLAVNSPHFTGRALDLYVGGDPVDTKDSNRTIQVQTPVYKWLVRNADRFGFRPYCYEPWHWEYVGETRGK